MKIPDHLRRIAVVGSSCAGKSTFANRLSAILKTRHIQIDELAWKANWEKRPVEELRQLLRKECARESWIIDGNYEETRDIVWQRATAVIWLDFSFPLVMYRAFERSFRRVFSREEIYSGNRETFRLAFMSRDSVIYWAVKRFRFRRRQYRELLGDPRYSYIRFLRFKNQVEANEYLQKAGTSSADVSA